MNIDRAIFKASQKLKGTETAHLDAEILLSYILKQRREYIIANSKKEIQKKDINRFYKLISKRNEGYPVAYLINEQEFYGLNFFVNKNVLVPRPATEIFIDHILEIKKDNLNIIDVGTGSGCIIITLAKLMKQKNIQLFGLDISSKALQVAKQNAKLHKIKNIKFLKSNLLEKVLNKKFAGYIIITANLPYLTTKLAKTSPTIQKEPKLALEAGSDGLKYYKELFSQVKKIKGNKIDILCEINKEQRKNFEEIIKKYFDKSIKVVFKKDLSKKVYLVVIQINN